jgi:hypothetical protein
VRLPPTHGGDQPRRHAEPGRLADSLAWRNSLGHQDFQPEEERSETSLRDSRSIACLQSKPSKERSDYGLVLTRL